MKTLLRFNSYEMNEYRNTAIDDWNSQYRYEAARNALINNTNEYSVNFDIDVLSGKYGFMCQYDKETNADTV